MDRPPHAALAPETTPSLNPPVHVQASDRVYYLYQTLLDADQALQASPEGQAAMQAAAEGAGAPAPLLHEVHAALLDDLNTPAAVAALSTPLKEINDLLHTKKARAMHGQCTTRHAASGVRRLLRAAALPACAPRRPPQSGCLRATAGCRGGGGTCCPAAHEVARGACVSCTRAHS